MVYVSPFSAVSRSAGLFRRCCCVLAAVLPALAPAQSFSLVSSGSPFAGIDVGEFSKPDFVDIDNDGDEDLFVGEASGVEGGTVNFFRNTGTPADPVFVQETGSSNPLNGVDVGDEAQPFFADIDNDGDQDCFIGINNGRIAYYQNTGTASAPVLTAVTGTGNPFNTFDVGANSIISLEDLDGDGDLDAMIGEDFGILNYFPNTGTASSPVFAQVTGSSNPFNNVNNGDNSYPMFADLDQDGDPEALLGEESGILNYYLNQGSASNPVFAAQTGGANPLNGVDVGLRSAPSFVDIDNDGDQDLVIGARSGTLTFYRNTSLLPVEWLWIQASVLTGDRVALSWATASEQHNLGFEIQRSADMERWEAAGFMQGAGTSQTVSTYTFTDPAPYGGVSFYRLEQLDIDGTSARSAVVEVRIDRAAPEANLYPNPATRAGTLLTLAAMESQAPHVQLLDLSGRSWLEADVEMGGHGVASLPLRLSDVPPGMYVVMVRDGQRLHSARLLVR
ncbi:MAG: T9SS type A sorting domain-containing protein [Bacteroidia bacterium]|nr:T9SS type A sorting domain-containing protein [Bacteroidia bacterium]